ncbi:MAG: hypothetical protein V2A73_19350, partial [Pseudomonadota bacterium]
PISLAAAIRQHRWREEHARVIVTAWRDSGLTMREFAGNQGVPLKRLERWSCKLRKVDEARPEQPVRFLPVEISKPVSAPANIDANLYADSMELALPTGIRVTLRTRFDTDALQRLLEVVGC